MKIFKIIFICLLMTSSIELRKKRIILVDMVEVCYIPKNPPYKLHYFNLHHYPNYTYYVSTSAEVLVLLEPRDLEGRLEFIRCASKEALDTCQKFAFLKPAMNICNFLQMEGLGFKAMMDSFTPKIRCPIKPGNYSSDSMTWDLEKFPMFSLEGFYWKIRLTGYLKKRLVGAVCFNLDVKSVEV